VAARKDSYAAEITFQRHIACLPKEQPARAFKQGAAVRSARGRRRFFLVAATPFPA